MKKLGYWKSRKEWKRLTQGMNPDQVARLKESLPRGDEAVLEAITEIQTEQRAGIGVGNTTPEIGKDIAWSDVLGMAFRVIDFDKNGTQISNDGTVTAIGQLEPYGYLLVDSPTLNKPVRLPIIHKDDFILAASVFDDPLVVSANKTLGRELLVTYKPEKVRSDGRSKSPAHCLHYALTPAGTLDDYYADVSRMARPEPELLFGKLNYTGMISVSTDLLEV